MDIDTFWASASVFTIRILALYVALPAWILLGAISHFTQDRKRSYILSAAWMRMSFLASIQLGLLVLAEVNFGQKRSDGELLVVLAILLLATLVFSVLTLIRGLREAFKRVTANGAGQRAAGQAATVIQPEAATAVHPSRLVITVDMQNPLQGAGQAAGGTHVTVTGGEPLQPIPHPDDLLQPETTIFPQRDLLNQPTPGGHAPPGAGASPSPQPQQAPTPAPGQGGGPSGPAGEGI